MICECVVTVVGDWGSGVISDSGSWDWYDKGNSGGGVV